MSALDLRIVDSFELAPYVQDLRALESTMRYPIAQGADHFTLDHGTHYHPFFSSMGAAKFLLLLEEGRVQGVMAGVWRHIQVHDTLIPALYLADLKLAAHLRGRHLVLKMLWHGIRELFRRSDLGGWRIVYGAAMRGEQGDVMRSMRGALHPAGLLDFSACTLIYFASPLALTQLPDAPAVERTPCANFSPERTSLVHHTRGQKDFQLHSTGKPWSLVHMDRGPDHPDFHNLGHTLRLSAQRVLAHHPTAQLCFSLDSRATHTLDWLATHDIHPGATCTVYAMQLSTRGHPALADAPFIHLATSTI